MKTFKFLLILACLLVTVKLQAQINDCKRFHTGTFKMMYYGKPTIVVRTKTKQQQFFDGQKTPVEFTVKWLSDCTFTLTLIKGRLDKVKAVPPNAVLTMQIVKTSKNSYTQVTTANFTGQSITGEIFKVK
jgi:hypothetical protein